MQGKLIANEDDFHKENTRIKEVLQDNGYQESIISKTFKIITNKHNCVPQSRQLTQATDIQDEEMRMSKNLLYVNGTTIVSKIYWEFTRFHRKY